jgi:Ca-activated chloride channel family protein
MLGMDWVHDGYMWLLWAPVALVGALVWLELRGGDLLSRFVSAVMQSRLAERPPIERRMARLVFVFLALLLGVAALLRPQTPGSAQRLSSRVSADIMVVLDVSRSMLADDAKPTRLSRAKAEIADMVSKLDGHRIGLVAFAGRAAVLAPLTPDYSFFRMILDGVDTNSVSRGGTNIGEGLRKAIRSFDAGPGAKLILLITDGEDHDSYPREAAKQAVEAGIRIVSIGFGSEEGSQITLVEPDTGAKSLLVDGDRKPVVSRLDGALLRDLALETEGAYVPAGVAALDMESIVRQHLEPLIRDSATAAVVRTVPDEHYRWFALGALACLIIAVALGMSGRRARW